MSTAERARDLNFVEADLNYSVRTVEKPVSETYGRDGLERRYTGKFERHHIRIADARPVRQSFTLDTNGFELVDHPTRMKDFFDANELRDVYYAEMRALIAARSGATRVHVFDHTLRSGDEDERAQRKIREPVRAVHNDYTEWSGPQRVRDLLPDEAEELFKRRFAIIQVWRPFRHPIETFPLAICDARSVSFSDFILSERRYPNRVGQTYAVKYNPAHRWFWFPRQQRNEAIVFKVYDSEKDGRARWTAHTAFTDPTSPPNARPRESIEIRTLAFF